MAVKAKNINSGSQGGKRSRGLICYQIGDTLKHFIIQIDHVYLRKQEVHIGIKKENKTSS